MKILLISSDDPEDVHSWSGTSKSIHTALKKISQELVVFYSSPFLIRFFSKILSRLSTKTSDLYKTKIYSKYIAYKIHKIILLENPDIIIGVVASVELAFVKTNTPIIHISDATYNGLLDYYDKYLNVWAYSVRSSNELEQRVIDNAKYIILPSQWATISAITDYNCEPSKIKTIPFGPNIVSEGFMPKRRNIGLNKPCKLLFVALEWHRKGGDIAFNTMLNLRAKGIEATLQIIGCSPPKGITSPYMHVTECLDKHNPEQHQKLIDHYLDSTLFILPTHAEAFGIVFAESAMYGLPSISYNTGGVSSVIDHGKTGYLLPLGSSGNDFAKVIEDLISDEDQYQEMCNNSLRKYEEQLNWRVWQNKMGEIIASCLISTDDDK